MRNPREKVGQEMANKNNSKQNTVVRKFNQQYLEKLDESDLLAAIRYVNAIPDLSNTRRIITDPYSGKEILAASFMKAVNDVPGTDEEVLEKLMYAVKATIGNEDEAFVYEEVCLIVEIYKGLKLPKTNEEKKQKAEKKAKPPTVPKGFWSNLLRSGTFTQIPNILLYKLTFGCNKTTPLFLTIIRKTFGFPKSFSGQCEDTKECNAYRICWKLPKYKEVAKILNRKRNDQYISRLKAELIARKEIIEWGEYVGPNFALLSATQPVIDFLNEYQSQMRSSFNPNGRRRSECIQEFADKYAMEAEEIGASMERFYEFTERLRNWTDCPVDEGTWYEWPENRIVNYDANKIWHSFSVYIPDAQAG
jgi:hypothetical protein